MNQPRGLAFDSAGNLYVANYGSATIEKFTPSGVDLGLFASTYSTGYGLAFDGSGNLYEALGNGQIEEFTPGGVGSLIANTGYVPLTGLAFDGAGNLYAATCYGQTVEKFTPSGSGSWSSSVFTYTGQNSHGLVLDSTGNVYAGVWGSSGGTIEKFTPGGVESVFVGSGLSQPVGMAFDGAGNMLVTNETSGLIEKFSSSGTYLGVFAGSSYPTYIAIQPSPAPEPSTLALLGVGDLLGYAWRRRRLARPSRIADRLDAAAQLRPCAVCVAIGRKASRRFDPCSDNY